jgi:hypothetical protein
VAHDHHRGPDDTAAEQVAALQHLYAGLVRDVYVFFRPNSLVHERVERLTERIDDLDAFFGEHVDDLLVDHFYALEQLIELATFQRVVDGPLKVVEHRKQLLNDTLCGPRGQVNPLARDTLAIVVELRLQAKRRVEVLRSLGPGLLELRLKLVASERELRPEVCFQLRVDGAGSGRGTPVGSLRRAPFPRTAPRGHAPSGALMCPVGHD